MPNHEVIGDVSTTLTSLLTDALSSLLPAPPPIARVHDLQGPIQTDPPLMTVFLYEVIEDPTARNRPRTRGDVPPDVALRRPPMALILRYLITPWSNDRVTDQRMLGRAMQALYDSAILSGPRLQGALAGTTEALKISMNQLNLEERTRIWHAVQKAYHVSLSYDVRVANLDSLVEELVRPVTSRVLDGALPAVGP